MRAVVFSGTTEGRVFSKQLAALGAEVLVSVATPLGAEEQGERSGITVHCAALTREPVTVAGAVAHYLHSDQYHGVNRLDRGTTGVMVVAKTGYIHARCMALLHSGDFYREYRGICLGTPAPNSSAVTRLPV